MTWEAGLILASEVVSALMILYGTLRALKKWALKPIKAHFDKFDACVNSIENIKKEFSTNGGGSLKDHIGRLSIELSEVKQAQRAQLAYNTHPIFESDKDGHCTYANRAYLRMLGVGIEEIEGQGWKSFIHPDSRDIVFEEWESAVRDQRDFKLTYKFLAADGHEVCASCEAFAIKNDKKELLKYIGTITEHETLQKCDKS